MTKDAFVVMPFSGTETCTEAQWTEIYENVFEPAFASAGYACERAKPMVGTLVGSIIDRLRSARIVLADLTDRNPNVFYELGVRHCLRKGTILAAQGSRHIPSDLKGYWYIDYGTSPGAVTRFKAEIARLVEVIDLAPEKSDNPVADYLDREKLSIFDHIQKDAIKKLGALGTELTGLRNTLGEIARDKTYVEFLSSDCLRLLCQTMYVDVGPELLKSAYELTYQLKHIVRQPQNVGLISEATRNAIQLAGGIGRIREMMLRGEFSEPATVSTMQWVPVPRSAEVLLHMPGCYPAVRALHESMHESCHLLAFDESAERSPEIFPSSPSSDMACASAPLRLAGAKEPIRVPAQNGTFMPSRSNGPARRQPCPCGSGRRFKNCCGRG